MQNDGGNNSLFSLLNKIQLGNQYLGNIAEVNAGIMGGCDSITNNNMKYADTDYILDNDISISDNNEMSSVEIDVNTDDALFDNESINE